jgi:hypothetical protein
VNIVVFVFYRDYKRGVAEVDFKKGPAPYAGPLTYT